MKKIAIIGHGYVGKAMDEFFNEKYELVIYDPIYQDSDQYGQDPDGNYYGMRKDKVNECDFAVVCVPTPMTEGTGKVDTSYIDSTFEWLKTPLIMIKSTIPPGTTKMLVEKYSMEDSLVFSPELIGEGGYPVPFWTGVPHPTDMKYHRAFVFGGKKETIEKVLPFFERVRGAFCEYHMTDPTTAELMKYMENSWIATKVTFCNEFYDIAKHLGVSYPELRKLWLTDGRVTPSHTLVYPDKRGFDGKCIPKDTNGLVHLLKNSGYEPTLLSEVLETNKKFNSRNK